MVLVRTSQARKRRGFWQWDPYFVFFHRAFQVDVVGPFYIFIASYF